MDDNEIFRISKLNDLLKLSKTSSRFYFMSDELWWIFCSHDFELKFKANIPFSHFRMYRMQQSLEQWMQRTELMLLKVSTWLSGK